MNARPLLALLVTLTFTAPAHAAQCGGDFNTFLSAMSREAVAAGVSREVISSAFAGVTLDQAVLAFDRRQRGMFHARASRNMPPPALSRPASSAPNR